MISPRYLIPSIWFLLNLFVAAAPLSAHPSPGIVCTEDGTIYFVIGPAHQLWKIDGDGNARVLLTGSLEMDFRVPHHLVLDKHGNLYTASDAGSVVWKFTPNGLWSRSYPPDDCDDFATVGLGGAPFTITDNGDIIAIRETEERLELVRIDQHGDATFLAGGTRGFRDSTNGQWVQFTQLGGSVFAWGPDGSLYVDDDRRSIRRVRMDGGVETIFVGGGRELAFPPVKEIVGIVVADDGTIFAADVGRHCIWRITPDGEATTFAGRGERGNTDGPAPKAMFDEPVGLALHPDGGLLVLEQTWDGEHYGARVRLIDDGQVQTLTTVKARQKTTE